MRFVRPDNTRRKKSKAFSTGKIDFSGNFVSKDLSSPVERTYQLAQDFSEIFADRDRLFIELCFSM